MLTLKSIEDISLEVALQKRTGGPTLTVTLPLQQKTEICYEAIAVYLVRHDGRARIGIEAPADIVVMRI